MNNIKKLFCNSEGERPRLSFVFLRLIVFALFFVSIRVLVIEPFLVPSGSMFPNLLVNDYILVTKLSTGIKIPFTQKWLIGPKLPTRGEVVVFKSKDNGPYFVKRLVGLPGDHLTMLGNKLIRVNGQEVIHQAEDQQWQELQPQFDSDSTQGFKLFSEQLEGKKYLSMYNPNPNGENLISEFYVPQGQLFFMGDHRDNSSDSRMWGSVPIENLVGPVWRILLSCERRSASIDFCDLSTIRWERSFKRP